MTIQTINPATAEPITTYNEMTDAEMTNIIDAMHETYLQWRKTSFAERSEKMRKAADILLKNRDQYAELITAEMGKPKKFARSEIEKCAWVCQHYADHAEEYLTPRPIQTEMSKTSVNYQPLGIVFAIMPWNFPFWQVFRFAVPTLMAGNSGLLKPAAVTSGCGKAVEEILLQAGFPENLFRTVFLTNETAAKVIHNKKIIAVTLTGSGRAGSTVGSEAAKALKKIVLELGGSDPYVVLADANLDKAAEAIVSARFNNSGQVCVAPKRIIAVESIKEPLLERIKAKTETYRLDDPTQEDADFGPLAREDIRDEVHNQVQQSINNGAKLVIGGEVPDKKGFYYPATILTDVKPGMPAYDDEIFGPVIAVIEAKDEDDAIRIANDTPFGLAGAVFTEDLAKGERIATEEIQAGACAVNTFVSSDPRLPFGGIKESGYGRELSAEGIRAFTNVKTVIVK